MSNVRVLCSTLLVHRKQVHQYHQNLLSFSNISCDHQPSYHHPLQYCWWLTSCILHIVNHSPGFIDPKWWRISANSITSSTIYISYVNLSHPQGLPCHFRVCHCINNMCEDVAVAQRRHFYYEVCVPMTLPDPYFELGPIWAPSY